MAIFSLMIVFCFTSRSYRMHSTYVFVVAAARTTLEALCVSLSLAAFGFAFTAHHILFTILYLQ